MSISESIFGVAPPSTKDALDIFQCGNKPLTFVCGSVQPTTFYRHWDGEIKRSYPCAGESCPCIKTFSRRIFSAYVLGLPRLNPHGSRPLGLVSITQSAFLAIENQIKGDSWLGLIIRLERTNPNRNARLSAQVIGHVPNVVADKHDIQSHLFRIWGIHPAAASVKKGGAA